MKRKTCLVLSAMMLAGVLPVSAAESQFEMVKNTYILGNNMQRKNFGARFGNEAGRL